jgi:VWFA-related protein
VRNTPTPFVVPAVVALSAALLAQAQFRTETTIVQVDVVVRDKTGRPVDDLDERAFEILENGVPQPLVWFERSVGVPSTPAGGPSRTDAGPVEWNQRRDVGTPQSLVALVFHQLGPRFRIDACRAADAMVDQLPPGDYAAVYLIDQVLRPLTGFTRDRESLRAAIQTVLITPPAVRPGGAGSSGVETVLSMPGSRTDQEQAGMRGRMEAGLNNLDAEYDAGMQGAAFSQLVADLDRFPGRRAVFLFSGGLAMPMAAPRIETVADRAAPRHVSFYAIVPGLGQPYGKGKVTRIERGELTSVSTETGRRPAKVSEMDPSLGLRQLAELTGGLYVTGSTDVDALLARANADRRTFYVLGYRTSAPAAEAGMRPIEVLVTRPGLRVRARTRIGQTQPASDATTAGDHPR